MWSIGACLYEAAIVRVHSAMARTLRSVTDFQSCKVRIYCSLTRESDVFLKHRENCHIDCR